MKITTVVLGKSDSICELQPEFRPNVRVRVTGGGVASTPEHAKSYLGVPIAIVTFVGGSITRFNQFRIRFRRARHAVRAASDSLAAVCGAGEDGKARSVVRGRIATADQRLEHGYLRRTPGGQPREPAAEVCPKVRLRVRKSSGSTRWSRARARTVVQRGDVASALHFTSSGISSLRGETDGR